VSGAPSARGTVTAVRAGTVLLASVALHLGARQALSGFAGARGLGAPGAPPVAATASGRSGSSRSAPPIRDPAR